MKKKLSILLCVVLLTSSFSLCSFAVENAEIQVKAKSVVLMDASSGQVLYSENEHEKLYPASVTKIMPLLIFMEQIDSGKLSLDDVVTASANASSKGGSQIWLKDGEQMTVDELLRAITISSANDACTALGEHVAGSEEGFVSMLNERAEQLGMKDTHFDNCTGLDDDTTTHLTTAYDIAIMSKELLSHERITTYSTVWMDELRDGATQLVNTNRLVRFYEGTTGLKTGTTTKAGYCVSSSALKNGLHLIAVVMGSTSTDDRFESAKSLLNWGFANYEMYTPKFDETLITEVKVIDGLTQKVMPEIEPMKSVTIKKGSSGEIQTEIELATDVQAPIEENQILGCVKFTLKGEKVCEYNLISPVKIEKVSFFDMVRFFFQSLSVKSVE